MPGVSKLTRELEHYEEIKGALLKKQLGRFVLIKGSELVGTYASAEDAYVHGLERFKLEPFLVKQITKSEPTEFVPAFTAAPHADL